MPRIQLTTRDGELHQLEVKSGRSLMERLSDLGVGDILALCGGNCSCATCHVYVDENWLPLLAPMTEDEDCLLDEAFDRQANSRLSCQIRISDELDGLAVTVAPED